MPVLVLALPPTLLLEPVAEPPTLSLLPSLLLPLPSLVRPWASRPPSQQALPQPQQQLRRPRASARLLDAHALLPSTRGAPTTNMSHRILEMRVFCPQRHFYIEINAPMPIRGPCSGQCRRI